MSTPLTVRLVCAAALASAWFPFRGDVVFAEASCSAEQPPQPVQGAPAAPAAKSALDGLPPELQMVLKKLDGANAAMTDVKADVAYEQVIPLLDEKKKSRGTLVFKKPDRLILRLGKPRNEEVSTNGKLWWVVSHNDKQVEIYKAAEDSKGNQETVFLDFGYGRGSEQLLKDYTVELGPVKTQEREGGGQDTIYRITFTPRPNPDKPARYRAIDVEVSSSLWLPRVLVLHEGGESDEVINTYTLTNIQTNTGVADAAFDYSPPHGYTTVEM